MKQSALSCGEIGALLVFGMGLLVSCTVLMSSAIHISLVAHPAIPLSAGEPLSQITARQHAAAMSRNELLLMLHASELRCTRATAEAAVLRREHRILNSSTCATEIEIGFMRCSARRAHSRLSSCATWGVERTGLASAARTLVAEGLEETAEGIDAMAAVALRLGGCSAGGGDVADDAAAADGEG